MQIDLKFGGVERGSCSTLWREGQVERVEVGARIEAEDWPYSEATAYFPDGSAWEAFERRLVRPIEE